MKVICPRSNRHRTPEPFASEIIKQVRDKTRLLPKFFGSQPRAFLLPFIKPHHEQSVEYPVHISYLLTEWKKMDNSELNLIVLRRAHFSGRLCHLRRMQSSEAWKDLSKAWQSEFKYLGINVILGSQNSFQENYKTLMGEIKTWINA